MRGSQSDHGTHAKYQGGCHCESCRSYHAEKRREQRARTGNWAGRGRAQAVAAAARMWREEHPEEWEILLKEKIREAQIYVAQKKRKNPVTE